MGLVLNEHYSAEQAIQSRSLGKKPFETLTRVARYYIDTYDGIKKKQLTQKMESFVLMCVSEFSSPKWSGTIEKAINKAYKHKAININSLVVSKPELDKVLSLQSKQVQRLAFTLLCLSKYWDAASPKNNHWVNCKDSEIMAFANINTSIKRQCAMYNSLEALHLIQFSKRVDNTNVRVCFCEEGENAMVITDLRNLGYQLLKYIEDTDKPGKYLKEHYFECANCGIITKARNPHTGRKQKYCKECASKLC